MSFDLGVFAYHDGVTTSQIKSTYIDASAKWEASLYFSHFIEKLLEKYPLLDNLPDAEIDSSPWAYNPGGSDGHVILGLVSGSVAGEALQFIEAQVRELGLIIYDPQGDEIITGHNISKN